MNRTGFLAAIAVAALMLELFPSQAGPIKLIAIALGLLYLVVRALRTYPRQFREKRQRAAQQAADEEDYRRYAAELDLLRKKYAASDAGGTSQPSTEYTAELAALHTKYQAMLSRKFGRA